MIQKLHASILFFAKNAGALINHEFFAGFIVKVWAIITHPSKV